MTGRSSLTTGLDTLSITSPIRNYCCSSPGFRVGLNTQMGVLPSRNALTFYCNLLIKPSGRRTPEGVPLALTKTVFSVSETFKGTRTSLISLKEV